MGRSRQHAAEKPSREDHSLRDRTTPPAPTSGRTPSTGAADAYVNPAPDGSPRATTTTRDHCIGCGDVLVTGPDDTLCQVCRGPYRKGGMAWSRRMLEILDTRRAAGIRPKVPADPFEGFREDN